MKRFGLVLALLVMVSGTARAEKAYVSVEGGSYYIQEDEDDTTFVDWRVDGEMVSKQEFMDKNKARFQSDKEKFEYIKEHGKQYIDANGNLGYEMPDGSRHSFCNQDGTGTVEAGEFIQRSAEGQNEMLDFAETLPDISVSEREEMATTFNEHQEALLAIKAKREAREAGINE